ncbi:SspB family protein [Oceanicola sp. S124]|uniref:SspB family protein n=1 Tax=Oceanicola sp. S124 TaxID=1042378 RepID=UPI000255792A|nr:ClpXP protease specificity-enhancing factor SspB [Oceanicola sp. S124]
MARSIDYGNLMHRAMRKLIHDVLSDVARNGLPGAHHFFITFDTTHDQVELAAWLRDRYPTEMTVVMQHWFEDLDVSEDGFAVTLNFGDSPERMYIPLDAILTFVDPSVEFGLRFETQDQDDEDEDEEDDDDPTPPDAPPPLRDRSKGSDGAEGKSEKGDAEVVRLDAFRK